ncbi:holin family protein [Paracoccus sp. NGMCC 1.201697]|uniref:Holin family protein n=1 Tax=Paracoccus broussonetiae subsp. drimophilus TaxID=3373869 RepID=A0ABW7LGT6_9RHOB
MGMIERVLRSNGTAAVVANAASGVAEILCEGAARQTGADDDIGSGSPCALDFAPPKPRTWFDGFVDGLNRLPRPVLTMGTLALFVYAMVEPVGFGLRMTNLNLVPEPLWWLLGAIISFYFGAREAHYFRARPRPGSKTLVGPDTGQGSPPSMTTANSGDFADNAALRDWAQSSGRN